MSFSSRRVDSKVIDSKNMTRCTNSRHCGRICYLKPLPTTISRSPTLSTPKLTLPSSSLDRISLPPPPPLHHPRLHRRHHRLPKPTRPPESPSLLPHPSILHPLHLRPPLPLPPNPHMPQLHPNLRRLILRRTQPRNRRIKKSNPLSQWSKSGHYPSREGISKRRRHNQNQWPSSR